MAKENRPLQQEPTQSIQQEAPPEAEEKKQKVLKLTEEQKKDFEFVTNRIPELQQSRQDVYGQDLETIWAEADQAYIPHRLNNTGRKAIATDEERGWRGTVIRLGESNWQSDVSQSNPFIKIQAALSILVDQNPTGVFTPTAKKFQATNELIRQLYQRSWEYAKSKEQLKLFIFNLAKYGWAIGRTYPMKLTQKTKILTGHRDTEGKPVIDRKEVVVYDDIFRENIDPWNAWIDDMAKPSHPFSLRDWAWRKVYSWDVFEQEFGKYENFALVQPGGNTTEKVNTKSAEVGAKSKKFQEKKLVEVFFYENRVKDIFAVIANGTPVIIEPLPVADAKGVKKLSCWQTFWNLRHAECAYGVGLYEAIRYDQAMLDRIRNMTIDQLTLSIYKMFFFQGTQALTETGDIVIKPGVGKQVLNPKDMNWLDIPGPGQEAWMGIDMFRKDLDEASGITEPLMGTITGKTAFEIAQAKEAALKRLKTPLNNILEALNEEGYITVVLMQLLYSVPEVYDITDPELIASYIEETGNDPSLYQRDPVTDNFQAKIFREFPLNLDTDENETLVETPETKFFRVKPDALSWEGVISIKAQSVLTPSKQVDKALELEMYNMLIPLLSQMQQEYMLMQQMGQQPSLDNLTHGKTAKAIIKLYDKDPKEIIPDTWLGEGMPPQQPGIPGMPGQPPGMPGAPGAPVAQPPGQGGPMAQGPQAQSFVPQTQLPSQKPQGVVQKLMGRLTQGSRV